MLKFLLLALIAPSVLFAAEKQKTVECSGNTVITVGNAIGAQTPFDAVFQIKGDSVEMIEGDNQRFSSEYKLNEELTRPERNGYGSENGNLFFFKKSGRFQILKIRIVNAEIKSETTDGNCKAFTKKDVF